MKPSPEKYVEAASWLFGEVEPDDGYSEAAVSEVAQRLGFRLPTLLRTVYLRTGRRDDFHQAQNRLRELNELTVENRVLVFLDENQGSAFWGVPVEALAEEDPPVLLGSDDFSRWEEFDHLNQFLHARLFWVRMELAPQVLKYNAPSKLLAAIEQRWPPISVPPGRSDVGRSEETAARWYGGDDVLALVLGKAPSMTIQIASFDDEPLRKLGKELCLQWDEADWNE